MKIKIRSRVALALLIAFCLVASSFAISAEEAVNFISNENFFVDKAKEKAVIDPNTKIYANSKAYWVVTILSGDSPSCMIPISDNQPITIPKDKLLLQNLIETAYLLRLINSSRQNYAKQGLWPLTTTTSALYNAIATALNNEIYELQLVENKLSNYNELVQKTVELQNIVRSMANEALGVATKINEAINFETNFFSKPKAEERVKLFEKYNNALESIINFEDKRKEYITKLNLLKQGITQTDLSFEEQRLLNQTANPPDELIQSAQLANNALTLKAELERIEKSLPSRTTTLLGNLETRLKRNEVAKILYGSNSEIQKLTESNANSLQELVENITNSNAKWKETEKKKELEIAWKNALYYFNLGKYELAKSYAKKAKYNAILVYKGGIVEEKKEAPPILMYAAIILTIILFALIFYQKILPRIAERNEEDVI